MCCDAHHGWYYCWYVFILLYFFLLLLLNTFIVPNKNYSSLSFVFFVYESIGSTLFFFSPSLFLTSSSLFLSSKKKRLCPSLRKRAPYELHSNRLFPPLSFSFFLFLSLSFSFFLFLSLFPLFLPPPPLPQPHTPLSPPLTLFLPPLSLFLPPLSPSLSPPSLSFFFLVFPTYVRLPSLGTPHLSLVCVVYHLFGHSSFCFWFVLFSFSSFLLC